MIEGVMFSPAQHDRWEDFLRISANGMFPFSRDYLSYHPPQRFPDASMLFLQKGSVVALFPAALIQEDSKLVWVSHPGLTYGGLLVENQIREETVEEIVDILLRQMMHLGCQAIEIKIPASIFSASPLQQIEYALWRKGFVVSAQEISEYLDLDYAREKGLLKSFRPSASGAVKKALHNGLATQESTDFRSFWNILSLTLRDRHQVAPAHTIEEIELLHSRFPDKIRLFGAYLDHAMIAGCVLYLSNKITAHTQYLAANMEYAALCPMNLAVYGALEWLLPKSFRYLNFGVSTTERGKIVNQGLQRFKENFGGNGSLRSTYRYAL